ncbi:MAG TPA: carboxylating nicotinate-nucleotide diphosphorylase [Candidatus Limiplasma sp.]|nr:carboxylating nicotinate-nucleotide diphosphorylase [Candidatus Limiplasma sp.]HRX08235.1 carboxylating nicotinate-nucleotide diphosphorylase [Candidatus Limiplasma sp.]
MIDAGHLHRIIKTALEEDVNTGDITTASTVKPGTQIKGRFIAKADGVLCGTDVVKAVFSYVDAAIAVDFHFRDGDLLRNGDVIAEIGGDAAHILTGERTALNLLQHMSGIATRTRETVAQVAGYDVHILDTRKTTPGLRILEKYAVGVGGGQNHRFSLADGILIKDNHIRAAGGITQAVEAARSRAPFTLKIEVETETLSQVQEALDAGADIIMLDNMTTEQMREAVALIGDRAVVEASGNMGQRDLREVAATGVDCISVGDLTNFVRPLDISLKLNME